MADTDVDRWSQLQKDLLTLIAKRLNTRVDALRLRSVCSSWRSSIPPFKKTPPLPLILPFPIAPDPTLNQKRRRRLSLSESTIYFLEPSIENPKPNASKSKPSSGWLLRVEKAENGKMHPLNPLSKFLTEHVPITFPKVLNLLNFRITEIGKAYSLEFVERSKNLEEKRFGELSVWKVVMSSSPWIADDYAVMVIHAGKLRFISLGDKKWSAIDDPKQCFYHDVVHHKGQFYAVDYRGRAVVIGSDLKAKEFAPPMTYRGGGEFKHLVESCGDLFLIESYLDAEEGICFDDFIGGYIVRQSHDPEMPVHLKVFKLNEEKKEWVWVETLGDRVFFVADDCSYSVSARDFAGLKGDCIYFSEEFFAEFNKKDETLGELCVDTGMFSLEDGSCGPLASFPDHSQFFWPPPAWLKQNPRASNK